MSINILIIILHFLTYSFISFIQPFIMYNLVMDKVDLKNKIRGFITSNGHTLDSVAHLISAHFNRPESLQNLSQKLSRGSIKFTEVADIAEVLGYDVEFVKKR